MIELKDEKLLYEIPCLHPILIEVLIYCYKLMLTDFGKNKMVITSMYRPDDADRPDRSGKHAEIPLPAVDLRSYYFTTLERKDFIDRINRNWYYGIGSDGKKHPVCYYHKNHFHIQVSDDTVKNF